MPHVFNYSTKPPGEKRRKDDIHVEVRVFNHPYDEVAEEKEADSIGKYTIDKHFMDMEKDSNLNH